MLILNNLLWIWHFIVCKHVGKFKKIQFPSRNHFFLIIDKLQWWTVQPFTLLAFGSAKYVIVFVKVLTVPELPLPSLVGCQHLVPVPLLVISRNQVDESFDIVYVLSICCNVFHIGGIDSHFNAFTVYVFLCLSFSCAKSRSVKESNRPLNVLFIFVQGFFPHSVEDNQEGVWKRIGSLPLY